MTQPQPYVPTAREQKFLESVEEGRYEREIISGLGPFFHEKAPEDMLSFYSKDEVTSLKALKGTDRDVETRMPVKITRHYYELARTSAAIQRIVKADPAETMDLAGSEDPGNQMDYSPVEGLLHKYEMGLMYVISTCSAHCRFCYREELIARKQIKRKDGTIAKKGLAMIPEIIPYIKQHNAAVAKNGGVHPESGREKLREILMSGGDAMVLNNSKIAAWLGALAEAGVESIRIGTKDMAFYPQRFDRTFLSMLDRFHETYPQVGLHMMLHFEHPDEFLAKDAEGNYIEDAQGFKQWVPATGEGMRGLASRGWLTVENQAPIMKGINDDADALRILQREFKRAGGENHYFFCGRDIIAYKAFNVPIETAWNILNDLAKGAVGRRVPRAPFHHPLQRQDRSCGGHQRGDTGTRGQREWRLDLQDSSERRQRPRPRQGLHRRPQPRGALVRRLRGPRSVRRGRLVRLRAGGGSRTGAGSRHCCCTGAEYRRSSSRSCRMIDKRVASAAEAVSDIFDGATIMFGGFGEAGSPIELIHALIDQGATNLTMISNNCGSGQVGLAALLKAGRVSKVICSFPRTANSTVFPELYRSGRTKLELVPQGTLAERIRAGGAGIPAFYTPSAVGTPLAEGKECREFGGRKYLLEHGIRADFSLIKGRVADTHGNILYNKTARNFGPPMAMAGKVTIVQVAEVVEPGKLDPESIVTPGIFVDRVVAIANPAHESELVEAGASYP